MHSVKIKSKLYRKKWDAFGASQVEGIDMEEINNALLESLKRIEPAENINKSLAKVLKAQAEGKKKYFQSLANYYRLRYRMSPEEFYASYIEGRDHSWEEEESHFDWVTAIQMIEEMDEIIRKLEEMLVNADD